MRRFYFDPKIRNGNEVLLSEEESHHIAKVLRLPVGAAVELLDGQGTVYRAVIAGLGRRVALYLEGVAATEPEPAKTVRVGQGILKGDKMDTVVQKCTELGATHFTPFHSARCQGKLDPAQARKKQERWQRIGLEACKQCLRLRVPCLDAPVSYHDMLQNHFPEIPGEQTLRLLFWEEEKELHLRELTEIAGARSVTLLLGPEGGFAREEVEQARSAGFRTVSLGQRILRAETATLTALAIVQFLGGNL